MYHHLNLQNLAAQSVIPGPGEPNLGFSWPWCTPAIAWLQAKSLLWPSSGPAGRHTPDAGPGSGDATPSGL